MQRANAGCQFRVERANGADVACFGAFNTESLGATVDALISGVLVVHWLISEQ